ncbi:MAG: hypothetical protein RR454_03225, partial [Clostridia bacterium]
DFKKLDIAKILQSIEAKIEIYSIDTKGGVPQYNADGTIKQVLLVTVGYNNGVLYISIPARDVYLKLTDILNVEKLIKDALANKTPATEVDDAPDMMIDRIIKLFDSINISTSGTVINLSDEFLTMIMNLANVDVVLPKLTKTSLTIVHPNSLGKGFTFIEPKGNPFGVVVKGAFAQDSGYALTLELGGLGVAINGSNLMSAQEIKKYKEWNQTTLSLSTSIVLDMTLAGNKEGGFGATLTGVIDSLFGNVATAEQLPDINLFRNLGGKYSVNLNVNVNLADVGAIELKLEIVKTHDNNGNPVPEQTIFTVYYNGKNGELCVDLSYFINAPKIKIENVKFDTLTAKDFIVGGLGSENVDNTPVAPTPAANQLNTSENEQLNLADPPKKTTMELLKMLNGAISLNLGSAGAAINISGTVINSIFDILVESKMIQKDIKDIVSKVLTDKANIGLGINYIPQEDINGDKGLNISVSIDLPSATGDSKLSVGLKNFAFNKQILPIDFDDKEYIDVLNQESLLVQLELGIDWQIMAGLNFDLTAVISKLLGDKTNETNLNIPAGITTDTNTKPGSNYISEGNFVVRVKAGLNMKEIFKGSKIEPLGFLKSNVVLEVRKRVNDNGTIRDGAIIAKIAYMGAEDGSIYLDVPILNAKIRIDNFDLHELVQILTTKTPDAGGLKTAEPTGIIPNDTATKIVTYLKLFSSIEIKSTEGGAGTGLFVNLASNLIGQILDIAGIKLSPTDAASIPETKVELSVNFKNGFDSLKIALTVPDPNDKQNTARDTHFNIALGGIKLSFEDLVIENKASYSKVSEKEKIYLGLKGQVKFDSTNATTDLEIGGVGDMINGLIGQEMLDSLLSLGIEKGLSDTYDIVLEAGINLSFLSKINGYLKNKDTKGLLNNLLDSVLGDLQLNFAITQNDTTVIRIFLLNNTAYADLSFFGLPKVKLENLNLNELIKGLLPKDQLAAAGESGGAPVAPSGDVVTKVTDYVISATMYSDKIVLYVSSKFIEILFKALNVDFKIDKIQFSVEAGIGKGDAFGHGHDTLAVNVAATLLDKQAKAHTNIGFTLYGLSISADETSTSLNNLYGIINEFSSINNLSEVAFKASIGVDLQDLAGEINISSIINAVLDTLKLKNIVTGINALAKDVNLTAKNGISKKYVANIGVKVGIDNFKLDIANIDSFNIGAIKFNSLEAKIELLVSTASGMQRLLMVYYYADANADYLLVDASVIDPNLKIKITELGLLKMINGAIGSSDKLTCNCTNKECIDNGGCKYTIRDVNLYHCQVPQGVLLANKDKKVGDLIANEATATIKNSLDKVLSAEAIARVTSIGELTNEIGKITQADWVKKDANGKTPKDYFIAYVNDLNKNNDETIPDADKCQCKHCKLENGCRNAECLEKGACISTCKNFSSSCGCKCVSCANHCDGSHCDANCTCSHCQLPNGCKNPQCIANGACVKGEFVEGQWVGRCPNYVVTPVNANANAFNIASVLGLISNVTLENSRALSVNVIDVALTELLQLFDISVLIPEEAQLYIQRLFASINLANKKVEIGLHFYQGIKTQNPNEVSVHKIGLDISNYSVSLSKKDLDIA